MTADDGSPPPFSTELCQRLRALALSLPEVAEGSSCVNRAFAARKKNFLFLGEKPEHIYVMVKLADSLEAAQAMNDPRVSVGKFAWLTLRMPYDDVLDAQLLCDWIVESYRTCAHKSLVRQLEGA